MSTSGGRQLGTLGIHLDGRPCRVGCSFCYLGARAPAQTGEDALDASMAAAVVAAAPAAGIAVAVSEPATRWRAGLEAVKGEAARRGIPVAVTTTPAVIARDSWVVDGCRTLNLSIDPDKGSVDVRALRRALRRAFLPPGLEVVGLVSMVSPEFAGRLAGGLLAELVAEPAFTFIGVNALKPPPAWCDRAFWLRFLARIRPLLDEHLHRRLHLDCYVSARILGLGACPKKPDVTAGREFRACVYQARPDFVFADAADLAARTADYDAPATCPFAIV
jgi:hypothetical protein